MCDATQRNINNPERRNPKMKTVKKLTTLLIVLTLLFALSATAYAQNTYTINFYVNGIQQNTWQLTGNVGDSVYTTIHNSLLNDVFYLIQDPDDPAISYQYLDSLMGYATMPGTANDVPQNYTNFTPVANYPGFFLLRVQGGYYYYLYVGLVWTYSYQGGGNIDSYMDTCFPSAHSVINVTYGVQTAIFMLDYQL